MTGDTAPFVTRRPRFEDLIPRHRASLYRYALSLTRNAADAQDLVQDTLVRSFLRFETFRHEEGTDPARVLAWLYRIQRNLFLGGAWRSARRERSHRPFADESPAGGGEPSVATDAGKSTLGASRVRAASVPPEAAVVTRAEAALVTRALDALPEAYREALSLVVREEVPYAEAARRLGVPVGTVRSRINRARARVRRAVRRAAGPPRS